MSTATADELDLAELEELRSAHDQIREQIARQIVGQDEVVEQLLIAIFARGHCLLDGRARAGQDADGRTRWRSRSSLEFNRIQFTPDLMPSDITGTEVLQEDRDDRRRASFEFVRGPIFANIVLADEINRTPPKTQAALLEAMQERQVTVGGQRHRLPDPFFVLATQNPIEQEGTYPLPEAQLDRFMFKILVDYPTPEEERRIVRLTTGVDAAGDHAAAHGRADRGPAAAGPAGAGRRPLHRLRDGPGPGDPRARARRPEVHRRVGRLGRRAAGRPVPDPRRQGPRRARRPAQRRASTTSGPWPGRCCGTGSSPTTTPRPRARRATRSSSGCWTTSRSGREPPMPPSRKYSDPDVIAQIADLDLRSRRLVEGAISGQHRSPFHGFNIEFAEYREYTPGDDLRRLDWRVFARSDRHYIKQYEEESNVRVTFVVDASASMNYRGSRPPLSKFDYAATLVVSLAMLLARQQDPVGLVLFDEEAGTVLPAERDAGAGHGHVGAARTCTPARKTELGGLLRSLTDQIRRRGLLVIVSDLFTDLDAVYDGLNRLRFLGHEVLVMQVLDRDELELPFDGPTSSSDIEGDEELFAEPWAFRRSYQEAMDEFLDGVRRECGGRGLRPRPVLHRRAAGRVAQLASCTSREESAGHPQGGRS